MITERGNIRDTDKPWQAWVGIHDHFEKNDWVTIFGQPLSETGYAKWGKYMGLYQQPDNGPRSYDEDCVALMNHPEVGLNDAYCGIKLAFICELF